MQIGDWGRQGHYNQSNNADAMAAAAQRAPPRFVISVGDNFYPSGLTSVGDANFADSFRDVYHHPELQVRTRVTAQVDHHKELRHAMCWDRTR